MGRPKPTPPDTRRHIIEDVRFAPLAAPRSERWTRCRCGEMVTGRTDEAMAAASARHMGRGDESG